MIGHAVPNQCPQSRRVASEVESVTRGERHKPGSAKEDLPPLPCSLRRIQQQYNGGKYHFLGYLVLFFAAYLLVARSKIGVSAMKLVEENSQLTDLHVK